MWVEKEKRSPSQFQANGGRKCVSKAVKYLDGGRYGEAFNIGTAR